MLAVAAPTASQAATNVSPTREHQIRLAVNRYVEIQVSQREPYCYGGTGPNCFDCSGLVWAAYKWAGQPFPAGIRSSTSMRNFSLRISLRYARTGDLLFYDTDGNGTVNHVEMVYKKNGIGRAIAVSATHTGGPPVNFHEIRTRGLVKVAKPIY